MNRGSIVLYFFLAIGFCKAQNPIISLNDWDGDEQANAYYKDIDNDLDAFEGTWLYTNGNTSLKIVLIKKTQFFNGTYYEDLIVGEYQYIENGIEKVNTLSNINADLGYDHEIAGNTIFNDCKFLPINDCFNGEKRLSLGLTDPITQHWAYFVFHKRMVNGQSALKVRFSFNYGGTNSPEEPKPFPSMPWQGRYTLIKQ